jgi:hypothetical protein
VAVEKNREPALFTRAPVGRPPRISYRGAALDQGASRSRTQRPSALRYLSLSCSLFTWPCQNSHTSGTTW